MAVASGFSSTVHLSRLGETQDSKSGIGEAADQVLQRMNEVEAGNLRAAILLPLRHPRHRAPAALRFRDAVGLAVPGAPVRQLQMDGIPVLDAVMASHLQHRRD